MTDFLCSKMTVLPCGSLGSGCIIPCTLIDYLQPATRQTRPWFERKRALPWIIWQFLYIPSIFKYAFGSTRAITVRSKGRRSKRLEKCSQLKYTLSIWCLPCAVVWCCLNTCHLCFSFFPLGQSKDEIDAIGGKRFSQGTSADREIQRTLQLGQTVGTLWNFGG